jgi:acid phosphatase type 7
MQVAWCVLFAFLLIANPAFGSPVDSAQYDSERVATYTVVHDDPSSGMWVLWITKKDYTEDQRVRFRPLGSSDGEWDHSPATKRALADGTHYVYGAELNQLSPGTEYEFVVPGDTARQFQTIGLCCDLRFVVGGCIGSDPLILSEVNRRLAKHDPQLAVLGGDISYANARVEKFHVWERFLKIWEETMVDSRGNIIPIVPVIGNHEINKNVPLGRAAVTWYFDIFMAPEDRTYARIDLGTDVSMILLDTGHISEVDGDQLEWIKQNLQQTEDRKWVIPVYHEDMYPTRRSGFGGTAARMRSLWPEVFEGHANVRVAFEHHDHVYKRTHPLKNGKVDNKGIVYIGGGGWGTQDIRVPRDKLGPGLRTRWYTATSAAIPHAVLVDIQGDLMDIQTIGLHSAPIDSYLILAGAPSPVFWTPTNHSHILFTVTIVLGVLCIVLSWSVIGRLISRKPSRARTSVSSQ